jgi:ammonium transporter, Amt family
MMQFSRSLLAAPPVALLANATFDAAEAAAASGDAILVSSIQLAFSGLWVLTCAFLVFFMQCGFALLEAGSVRAKNTRNILLKNVIDACAGALVWYAVGSAFAGVRICNGNPFIGTNYFFSSDNPQDKDPLYFIYWVFDWSFSATAATIVSGAVAERTQFRSYVLYTILMIGWVYPVVAHWVWSADGWLSAYRKDCSTGELASPIFSNTVGLIDLAGSGVVHVTGGGAALVGAIILGPRIGRYTQDGHSCLMPPSSPAYQALGTLILWVGWYGFNSGSSGCFYGRDCILVTSNIATNTTLAAGAGGVTALLITIISGSPGDVTPLLNGILIGLVSITGSCSVVENYAAVIIGLIGSIVYIVGVKLLKRFRIDDPLEASVVHYLGGCWGLIAAGFFATESKVQLTYGRSEGWGVFYGGGGGGNQLGIQFLGVLVISVWSGCFMSVVFYTLKLLNCLRVSREEEYAGLDLAHGLGSGMAVSLWPPSAWFGRGGGDVGTDGSGGFFRRKREDFESTSVHSTTSSGGTPMRRVSLEAGSAAVALAAGERI